MAASSTNVGTESDVAAVSQATSGLLGAVNNSDLHGILATWCDDGVLMPPGHPPLRGRLEIEAYFARLFRQRRFKFFFTFSAIEVTGDVALERIEYRASSWPVEGGAEALDKGKGLHVYRRRADGSWGLAIDIWNSDGPATHGAVELFSED